MGDNVVTVCTAQKAFSSLHGIDPLRLPISQRGGSLGVRVSALYTLVVAIVFAWFYEKVTFGCFSSKDFLHFVILRFHVRFAIISFTHHFQQIYFLLGSILICMAVASLSHL